MSLPACQQRELDRIGETLMAGDPGLARLFAFFTRLTCHEALPGNERVPARRPRRPLLLPAAIPVVLLAVLTVLTLISPAPARRPCGRAAASVGRALARSGTADCLTGPASAQRVP